MRHTSYVSVAVRKTPSEALHTAISKMPQPVPISPGTNRIVIKPSIYDLLLPGNTSYGMMKAVTAFFKQVARLSIVESDNPLRSAEEAFSGCNFDSLRDDTIELVNLSTQPESKATLAGNYLTEIMLPKLLLNQEFLVNLATLKKQDNIMLGAGVKNLFGLLPQKDKSVFHGVLNDVLIDLLLFFAPKLTIIDLTYLVEGDRKNLKQRQIGGVVVGTDPVAVDAYCATLIGIDPMKIPYLRKAFDLGLGEALPERIQVFGTEHQKSQLIELCSI